MIKKSPSKKTPAKKTTPSKKKTSKTSPKKAPAAKKTAAKGTRAPKKAEPDVTILRTSKCPSVSGKSTLTYNVGVDDRDRVHVRINANSGGGFWSKEWVPLDRIEAVAGAVPDSRPVTALDLAEVVEGKSVNTPGYLLAAMLKEGVLETAEGKKRHYVYRGTEVFTAKIDKLKAGKKVR